MDPRLVNGLIALTGIASAVAYSYVGDEQMRLAVGGYAIAVFGYCIRRFGDTKATP